MLINRILRWTVFMAILAAFAPAPASAQIGRFIKKKLKQTIVEAVVETVAPAEATMAMGGGYVPTTGPVFDESVIEMTFEVLAKFEQGMITEIAQRKAAASGPARMDAVRRASGLTDRQYAILKERVIPFCTEGVSTAGHSVPHVGQYVYSTQEIMALGPYCPRLSLSYKQVT